MSKTKKKMIVITDCMECPKAGNTCKAWSKLVPVRKFKLITSVKKIEKFILDDCPLDDVPVDKKRKNINWIKLQEKFIQECTYEPSNQAQITGGENEYKRF